MSLKFSQEPWQSRALESGVEIEQHTLGRRPIEEKVLCSKPKVLEAWSQVLEEASRLRTGLES
jgi:hypothetical protein